jgi:hypothetical protein
VTTKEFISAEANNVTCPNNDAFASMKINIRKQQTSASRLPGLCG